MANYFGLAVAQAVTKRMFLESDGVPDIHGPVIATNARWRGLLDWPSPRIGKVQKNKMQSVISSPPQHGIRN